MRTKTAVLVIFFFLVLMSLEAAAPARIWFAKGSFSATWSGVIRDGNQGFKLYLLKGQSLKIESDDVYTWFVISPRGGKLGCDGSDYCAPGSVIAPLPYSGDYLVSTDYRMSSCADCPVSTTRRVSVRFEAR